MACYAGSMEKVKVIKQGGGGGAIYFFGFIGAVVYYTQVADGFWAGVLGILKAIVWPAFLVYEALKTFGA